MIPKDEINDLNVLDLPYSDRQLIVVADDDLVWTSRRAARQEGVHENGINWAKFGGIALKTIMGGTGLLISEVAREAYAAWRQARESGLQILQISKSESKHLRLPLGHPREGLLYIGHPADPTTYFTIAEFHRKTFEHKFCEAIRLLMSLGASEISVEHLSGWSKEFFCRISVPLGEAGETITSEKGKNSKSTSELLYKATLPGVHQPKLPSDLIWYSHEPTWQSIARGRLEHGLQDFTLSVSYEDDFGVNAALKVAVKKSGLEAGGKFEDHQSTVWRISGKFKNIEEK